MKTTFNALLISVLLSCSASFIQAQQVNYQTIANDPGLLKNLNILLAPAVVDLSATNLMVTGWGLGANYALNDRVKGRFFYARSYKVQDNLAAFMFDYNRYNGVYDYPVNNLATINNNASTFLELGGSLALSKRLIEQNLKVILSSSSSSSGGYTYTNTKYIMVPGNVLKTVELRAGISSYATYLHFDNETLTASDSSILKSEVISRADGQSAGVMPGEGYLMRVNAPGFYAGLSFTTARNLVIQPEKYRKQKVNTGVTDIYVDVLYAPFIFTNKIEVNGFEYDIEAINDVPIKKRNIALRFGMESTLSRKALGMHYRIEGGIRPGVNNNWYMNCVMSIPTVNISIPKLKF